jgi:hypothetical protein
MAKLHPQTGPVTAAGKETSSRNATTHGGTSEKLIVAGECREDFDKLLNELLEEHSPETPEARNLVETQLSPAGFSGAGSAPITRSKPRFTPRNQRPSSGRQMPITS